MRAAAAFQHLATDTVSIANQSGFDGYGDPTYGSAVTYPARVVGEQKLIRGFSGAEVVARLTVYVLAAVSVQPTARVTLSTGGMVNSTEASALSPPILGAKREPDQSGLHHTTLYFG